MAGIAKVTLVGNIGRDPETRYTNNGTLNVQFSVAVGRRRTDASGNVQENTSWFRVTAWSRLAETMVSLMESGALGKGKQVFVSGTLEAREYQDQNNQTRTSLDVRADDIQLVGSRADAESQGFGGQRSGGASRPSGGDERVADELDDVPF